MDLHLNKSLCLTAGVIGLTAMVCVCVDAIDFSIERVDHKSEIRKVSYLCTFYKQNKKTCVCVKIHIHVLVN